MLFKKKFLFYRQVIFATHLSYLKLGEHPKVSCGWDSWHMFQVLYLNVAAMTSPVVYRSLDSVLNVLNSHKSDNLDAVSSLLKVYDNALNLSKENEKTTLGATKYPLIVLEGLDGCGKSTITKKLSFKRNAVKWCTPPKSIKSIRHLFDDHPQLRTAYYALGNYIAALECSVILKEQPVIMDRYWHSTAAYAIAQAVQDFPGEIEMPPQGDSFYQWPEDLMKPNAVLFLNVNETTRLERLSRRQVTTTQESLLQNSSNFRDNIIFAYKNMVNPEVVFVDSNAYVNKVVKALTDALERLSLK